MKAFQCVGHFQWPFWETGGASRKLNKAFCITAILKENFKLSREKHPDEHFQVKVSSVQKKKKISFKPQYWGGCFDSHSGENVAWNKSMF